MAFAKGLDQPLGRSNQRIIQTNKTMATPGYFAKMARTPARTIEKYVKYQALSTGKYSALLWCAAAFWFDLKFYPRL